MTWLFVLAWLAIGATVGILAAALAGASGRASREEERGYDFSALTPQQVELMRKTAEGLGLTGDKGTPGT